MSDGMNHYLALKLSGVMQAWGGHTMEDLRHTEIMPTRSAVYSHNAGHIRCDFEFFDPCWRGGERHIGIDGIDASGPLADYCHEGFGVKRGHSAYPYCCSFGECCCVCIHQNDDCNRGFLFSTFYRYFEQLAIAYGLFDDGLVFWCLPSKPTRGVDGAYHRHSGELFWENARSFPSLA